MNDLRTTSCPSCTGSVPEGAETCTHCGFGLVGLNDSQIVRNLLSGAENRVQPQRSPQPDSTPPSSAHTTAVLPTIPSTASPLGASGAGPASPTTPPNSPIAHPLPEPSEKDARKIGWALVAAAAVLAMVVGGLMNSAGKKSVSIPQATLTRAAVDNTTVTAWASNTLEPKKKAYQAANTLDGKDNTAWNHNGEGGEKAVGTQLRWRFDEPKNIVAITIRNGYVRSGKDKKVWQNNHRVRLALIASEGKSQEFTLEDTPDAQTLEFEFGRTSEISLEILSIYEGAKYEDVAITDVTFIAAS